MRQTVTHIVADELKGYRGVRRAYTDIPEGQMHYRHKGEGKVVLLIHMALSSSDEYTRMIALLAPKYRAIAPDLLGQGDSDMPPREYGVPDHARSIISFMDSLNIKKASLVGQHNGALVAAEIALTHPERVDKLVLSAIYCQKEEADLKAWLDKPEMQRVEVKWDGSHLMEYWERSCRFGESVQTCNERALDYFKAGPRGEELHWAGFKYHVFPKLSSIKCPTLLMCGSKDWLIPSSRLAQEAMPGSKLVIVEGGATTMYREMPRDVVAVILPFLDNPT